MFNINFFKCQKFCFSIYKLLTFTSFKTWAFRALNFFQRFLFRFPFIFFYLFFFNRKIVQKNVSVSLLKLCNVYNNNWKLKWVVVLSALLLTHDGVYTTQFIFRLFGKAQNAGFLRHFQWFFFIKNKISTPTLKQFSNV